MGLEELPLYLASICGKCRVSIPVPWELQPQSRTGQMLQDSHCFCEYPNHQPEFKNKS